MSCQVCGVTSTGGQFCVACGQPLSSVLTSATAAVTTRERAQPQRSTWLAFQEIRLLACPKCGAPNSAARWQCARCSETLDDRVADESFGELTPPVEEAPPVQPESAPWVALITVVMGVAAVAVAVAMLASRGVGPFGPQEPAAPVTQAAQVEVESVRASSAASGSEGLVADENPTTAWRTDGDGAGAWVELRLASAIQIDHLLVWNGDQGSSSSFAGSDRVRDVLIVFPEVGKRYTATFPDRNANFRVDMPDPPVAQRIRIRIRNVYGDAGRAALSEIEALANSSTPE